MLEVHGDEITSRTEAGDFWGPVSECNSVWKGCTRAFLTKWIYSGGGVSVCVCVWRGCFCWQECGRLKVVTVLRKQVQKTTDHEADHEVMCDWTMTCLEGPQSLNQMTWEQISRGKSILMQAEQGQTGNAITPGGNNKLHLTEVSSPLDRDKRSQTEQMAHHVINLLLCICCFSESGKSCPAFSCQQQSSTGPYRQERCSFYQSLFPSLLRTNILWPVQPPPILM